jgi:pimeloyl-ACP methyl ester carboxylesterase
LVAITRSAAAVALAALAACGADASNHATSTLSSTGSPTTTIARAAGGTVVVHDEVVVQDSAQSPPARLAGLTMVRTLRTVIRRPAATAAPPPVVVFAHGFNAEPEDYDALLDAWAAAGYLVAAPELPSSARNLPGEPTRDDVRGQTRDIVSVITALIDGIAGPIDTDRIAVAGHSDGGTTVADMLFNPLDGDTRIGCYLILSGATPDSIDDSRRTDRPVLIAVGAHDENGNLPEGQTLFAIANGPRALVEAPDGDHLDMYLDGQLGDATRALTVDYLSLVFSRPPNTEPTLAALAQDNSSLLTVKTSSPS